MPTDRPTLRATLIHRKLFVVPFAPWLAHAGPKAAFARGALGGVHVGDLTVVDETSPRELIVRQLHGSPRRLGRALEPWASSLGYGRLWLPNNVITLTPSDARRRFGTRCPTCRSVWSDETPEFWEAMHSAGLYPAFCWVCGSVMPQWHPWGEEGEVIDPDAEARMLKRFNGAPER